MKSVTRFDWGVLGALIALSFAVLAGLVIRVWIKGGIVTGSDGFLVVDQLQYLNWLRQAGEHVLVGNLYDLAPGHNSFLHPGVLISGLFHALGLGLVASYAVWKPVACIALFAGALAYTRRFLERTDDRRVALVLALFTVLPASALVGWTHIGGNATKYQFDFATNELWPGNYLWGYMFTAIAVGVVPLALLAYERERIWWAAAAGLTAAWLQPWQGITFALIVVASELIRRRAPVRALVPLSATALPLIYYFALSKWDAAWELAGTANSRDAISTWPWWVTVLVLLPLVLPALLAYRTPARDFGSIALRVWPIAALVIFIQPAGTFPAHAFQGMLLPLVVLATLGVRSRLGERPLPLWPVLAVIALLVIPGTLYQVDNMRAAINGGLQAHFLKVGEHDALTYLDDQHEPGGVLAPVYIGTVVPAYTGRETYIGAGSWTPDFAQRRDLSESLFNGTLTPAQADRFVRATGARFLLSDCHGRADITRTVAGFTDPPRRFGCATVWRMR